MFGDVEEKLIGMMPGVAGLVMRRRRQAAIGEPRAPVRLSFELDPVTGRAFGCVNLLTQSDEFDIPRVGERHGGLETADTEIPRGNRRKGKDSNAPDDNGK